MSPASTQDVPDGSDPAELAHWLFDRARAGEGQRVGAYLDVGVPADLTDSSGNTLLMLAAYHGHADTVATLISRGATVDARNDRGQTPITGAVFKGYPQVVQALLAANADPDAGTPSARQAAHYFEQSDMIELISQAGR